MGSGAAWYRTKDKLSMIYQKAFSAHEEFIVEAPGWGIAGYHLAGEAILHSNYVKSIPILLAYIIEDVELAYFASMFLT